MGNLSVKVKMNNPYRKVVRQTKHLEKHASLDARNYDVLSGKNLSEPLKLQAKKLHAEIYLERTFIEKSDIGSDGVMHEKADPHQKHSDYFVVVDKSNPDKVLATVRQIRADVSHEQLPILSKSKVFSKSKKSIHNMQPQLIVEISGLAKNHGTPSAAVLELYLSMWGSSMIKNHQMWLMACDVKLYRRLKILFGKSITRIGRRTHYKGGDVIPCKLELKASHIKLLKNLNSKHPIYWKARRAMAEKFLKTYSALDF